MMFSYLHKTFRINYSQLNSWCFATRHRLLSMALLAFGLHVWLMMLLSSASISLKNSLRCWD